MHKPMRWEIKATLIALGLSLFSIQSNAHPGGLDSNGCHNNNSLGVYECHSGEKAGTTWASREAFEASIVQPDPVVTPVEGISFVFEPDWSTLKERQILFRSETAWTVSDGQYLYTLERSIDGGEYRFKPVSRAKLVPINGLEQVISSISQ